MECNPSIKCNSCPITSNNEAISIISRSKKRPFMNKAVSEGCKVRADENLS